MTKNGDIALLILDSNNPNTIIHNVCGDCGIEANRLTYMKKYGKNPTKKCFSVSSYWKGTCDFCKNKRYITQTRDFFYPDFSLLPTKEEYREMKLQDYYSVPRLTIDEQIKNCKETLEKSSKQVYLELYK